MRRSTLINTRGLTLLELMIVTLITVPVLISVVYFFLQCMEFNDMAHNSMIAVLATRDRITQIEHTPFNQVYATYNNVTFSSPELTGKGVTYIDNSVPNVVKITASFSWRQKNGRIVGEDRNLDGQINAGEDKNGNGILDAPVMMTTYRYNS